MQIKPLLSDHMQLFLQEFFFGFEILWTGIGTQIGTQMKFNSNRRTVSYWFACRIYQLEKLIAF